MSPRRATHMVVQVMVALSSGQWGCNSCAHAKAPCPSAPHFFRWGSYAMMEMQVTLGEDGLKSTAPLASRLPIFSLSSPSR
jgi:hypothetical protein